MDKFEFELNGTTHRLVREFPFRAWRKTTGHDYIAQLGILLEEAAKRDPESRKALTALDDLSPLEVAQKLSGWLGASPGESSESSKS